MVEDRRRPIDAEHPVVVHGEGGSDELRGAELTVSGPILSSSATAAESSPNVVQVDSLRTGETSHERRKDRERAPWLRSYGHNGRQRCWRTRAHPTSADARSPVDAQGADLRRVPGGPRNARTSEACPLQRRRRAALDILMPSSP